MELELGIFRDKERVSFLIEEIKKNLKKPLKIMEVCGTHTQSFFRYGLKSLLPQEIDLVSGPGCPVCVTHDSDIDSIWEISQRKDVIVTTFGDMIKVPGSKGNLSQLRAEGGDVRVVISPMDAVKIAMENPNKTVVFIAVGFETTIPSIAYSIIFSKENNIPNFCIYNALKTMPNALDALFSDPETDIDGLILPGHVSSIIGIDAYKPIVDKYNIPSVVAGFEPIDLLIAILMIIKQINSQNYMIENAYTRVVNREGNKRAMATIDRVFLPSDAIWRGLGAIKNSGLCLREEFGSFDAIQRFQIRKEFMEDTKNPCKCGDVLKGKLKPPQCSLFKKVCTPVNPKGPCMVSGEGSCNAYFRFYDG